MSKNRLIFNTIFTAQAETVITSDQLVRGGKAVPIKSTVDKAVSMSPCVKQVYVMKRTGAEVPMGDKDIYLEEVRRSTER